MGDVRSLGDEPPTEEASEKRKLTNVPEPAGEALDDEKDGSNCKKRIKVDGEEVEPSTGEPQRTESGGSILDEEDPKDGESDDDDDEDYGEEGHNEDSETVADRKGKGVAVDYKGKGKLVVESDEHEEGDYGDDSSEDDFSDGVGDGGDSDDLEEDPLAEVDLDNILPSRTRQGGGRSRAGVRIAGDKGKDNDG